jgi:DNA-binding response OmpR family regulator
METEKINVLIVDDNDNWNERLASSLRHDPPPGLAFSVTTAGTVQAARDECAKSAPDVVVLDLMLPDAKDGLELLRSMKQSWPKVKVLLVTDHPGTGIPVENFEDRHRPDSYLTKPSDWRQAFTRVRSEIVKVLAEGKDYLLRALDNWSFLHDPNEPIFSSGGRDYTVADLKEEIRNETAISHLFREAIDTVNLEQLQQRRRRPTKTPQEIIEEKLKVFEAQLAHLGSHP